MNTQGPKALRPSHTSVVAVVMDDSWYPWEGTYDAGSLPLLVVVVGRDAIMEWDLAPPRIDLKCQIQR